MFAFIMLKITNLSRKYGNADNLLLSYACYSFCTGGGLRNNKTIYELKAEVLQRIEQYENSFDKYVFYLLIGRYVSHWTEHGSIGVGYLRKAVDYALEAEIPVSAGNAMTMLIENKYLSGVSLQELDHDCQECRSFTNQVRLLIYQLLIANLRGVAGDSAITGRGNACQDDIRERMKDDRIAIMTYHFSKIQLYYLFGDYKKVLDTAEEARENKNIIRGIRLSASYIFYYSLAITAGYEEMPANKKRKYRRMLKRNQCRMKAWSDSCPANFLHQYLLVAAEMARLGDMESQAMTLYDQSVRIAREHGYVQDEAIAGESAARFYLAKRRDQIAQVYLLNAARAYQRWGAAGKVRDLQERYPHLLTGLSVNGEEFASAELLKNVWRLAGSGDSGAGGEREMHAICQAVEKLAEEKDTDALLNGFLKMAVDHSGANKGFLILERDTKLFIEAAIEKNLNTAAVLAPMPLDKCVYVSRAMVRYVVRTLEPVVLNDREEAGIFARDTYIRLSHAKSIVCLPLMFQGISIGALFLENSLLSGVFTPDRLAILKLMAAQMACAEKLHAEDTAATHNETMPPFLEPLTGREREVLSLIADGMSNKEIARELQLTVSTVKTHILNIYGKLHVNRRVQAVKRAKELKLLQIKY